MSQMPPPPPSHLPENPEIRSERYRQQKRFISWWGIVFGIILGIAGGLYYAWELAPIEEFDTTPRQLRYDDKVTYTIGVALAFSYDSDLTEAINQLVALQLGDDPFQAVADIACDLAETGFVDSTSGLRSVRALQTFYQLQGREGCADVLLPDVSQPQVIEIEVATPTPTLPPPPSKTPTVAPIFSPTPDGVFVVPTTPPRRQFEGRLAGSFCDTTLSGVIEVFVQAGNGDGIPGERIRVRWDNGEDTFISGLKPERGPSYADFQMAEGLGYTIDMPSRSDPINTPLVAESCFTEDGFQAVRSYRIVFQQVN